MKRAPARFEWEPWDWPQEKVNKIEQPPCKYCLHWNPIIIRHDCPGLDSVVLCHAKDIFSDFSCFEMFDN